MFFFEYDFEQLVELVANALPDDDTVTCNSPLGQYACNVLSVDYTELAHRISNLLGESHIKQLTYPGKDISELLSDTFGEIACEEVEKLALGLNNIYFALQEKNSDINDIVIRLYDTVENYFYYTTFDRFKRIVVLQAYLEESELSADMLIAENFELFINGVYEGDVKIMEPDKAANLSEFSLDTYLFPDSDIRGMVRDVFLNLLPFGERYIVISSQSLVDFIATTIYHVFHNGYRFKRCKNCGRFFIPFSRSDELYCNQISPQDGSRTCKQYGTDRLWYDKLKKDEAAKLARNIYMQKQMLVKRNSDIVEYRKAFERFKVEKKQWEKDVKDGCKTREEYIAWLNSFKTQRPQK